ncbi:MAG: endonuclease/exonuclease/phosphatase family protein [Bacteroidales bacterium]
MKTIINLFQALLVLLVLNSCDSGQQYRIMTYNVKCARGMDNVLDYDRTAKVIADINPDIVALQELDSMTTRSGETITGEELADRVGMHFTFAKAIDFGGGGYGVGVFSKEQPIRNEKFPLPGGDEPRVLLLLEFERYFLLATHFSLHQQDRVESVNTILELLAILKDKPTILCGDLNAEPDNEIIAQLNTQCKLLSDTTINTFPADTPNRVLDYIYGYNANIPKTNFTLHNSVVVDEPLASDHRPVYIDVKF